MNKTKVKLSIKLVTFILVTCFCVGIVNEWLKPEFYYTDQWPATNTYEDFYRLEKDSVDVLLFGSSHAVSAFNPQVIYDNYGITSYNLGSEQQSFVVTYYWLREALKYQSPKVVVLDTYTLHGYTDDYVYNAMNCSEAAVRKAMDSMRFSPLKWEAGMVIERIDPTQNGLSFPLLNIRYHTRWTNLGEGDYTENEMIEHGGVKGYTVLGGTDPSSSFFTPFKDADTESVKAEEMAGTAKVFLDRIVKLCEKKGIQIVLVSIPCAEPVSRYKSTKEYAEYTDLPFYDFNEEVLYNKIKYNATEDGIAHPNYVGAEKISMYLGELLSTKYGILPRKDSSYDASRELYEHKIENIKLTSTTDINQYLDMINNDKYSVFIFGPTDVGTYIDDDIMKRLKSLGFTTDLRGVAAGTHYCAVKDASGITEKATEADLNFSGAIREGKVIYKFTIDTTNMLQDCRTYSMEIDGVECGNQNAGLNIVVYDNDLKSIVDKINFNTSVEELTATRY